MRLSAPSGLGPATDLAWPRTTTAHRLARLAADLVLVEIACDQAPLAGATSLCVDGVALLPPTASLRLGGAGGARLLFIGRDAPGALQPGVFCDLYRDDVWLAGFALDAAVPPLALLPQDRPSGLALLRFLVRTAAPLLRADAAGSGLPALCLAIARRLAGADGPAARPLCRPGATLSLWSVPSAPEGAWHLLDRVGIRRVAAPVDCTLFLDGHAPGPEAMLLPPGDAAEPIGLAPAAREIPSLQGFLAGAFRRTPHQAVATLASRAAARPRATSLLREAQLMAPAAPSRAADPVAPVGAAIELALSDREGGLFLRGWLRDPLNLVRGMELRGGIVSREVPLAALHRVARPDLAETFAKAAFGGGGPNPGFVAHLPGADHPAVAQWRLAVRLASGEALELTAPPAQLRPATARDLVLQSVAPAALRPGLLEDCIAPAAARLHRAALADAGQAETVHLGPPPRRLRAAIIVPLYRNLRFLRFQLAAFARDPSLGTATELVYVLDSPEQRSEVEHLLRGMVALHGDRAVTLVVMPENRGYASACNAGAAATTAPVLAMLNSDVLPAARGWLPLLLRRLARDRKLAAVGPRLLFEDGCLQHAGLLFRRGEDGHWLNDHYFKGFPRHYPAACLARRVPGVTGAALVVRRAAFLAVGGFSTDYIVGDFEDSDLCLALRAAGHEIGYEPAAELFHYERQSIGGHGGHARTLASAYNRLLQHRRWDTAITALMARFPEHG